MLNRSKKKNHQGNQLSKEPKPVRQGVGSGVNVGPAKPSLVQIGLQPTVASGQPLALGASVSGGGRTKKVKQTSTNKNTATTGGSTGRRARTTGKETTTLKANESTRTESKTDNGVGGLASENLVGPKMERSNSFFLTRKLSSLYSKLSGSRENVSTTNAVSPVTDTQPFQFVRSRSMSSIQLKRAYRRSQNESTLQNLHEDAILERSESTEETVPTAESEELSSVPEVTATPMPRFERSNSILASIRRKISFRSEKRSSNVSNWSTSLQNLRQEDFMISYDDLSFIDYDQFNSYETNIMKRQLNRVFNTITKTQINEDGSNLSDTIGNELPMQHLVAGPVAEETNSGVVRRRRKNDTLLRTTLIRKSMDVEGNLDRGKNVYRNSLDADKLLCISNVNRQSFRWSADVERDVVALDLESVDFAAAKALVDIVADRKTPSLPYDVCDSGMIDGSESVKLSTICDSACNMNSSVGYMSRSESLKRCRSYGGKGDLAFKQRFGRPALTLQVSKINWLSD